MDRRTFLGRVFSSAGIGWVARHLLEDAARAGPVVETGATVEADVVALPVKYPGPGATLQGYLARPKRDGAYPAISIHDRNGLTDGARGLAHRYAQDGFVALAVDPLSRRGGNCGAGGGPVVTPRRHCRLLSLAGLGAGEARRARQVADRL